MTECLGRREEVTSPWLLKWSRERSLGTLRGVITGLAQVTKISSPVSPTGQAVEGPLILCTLVPRRGVGSGS